MPLQITIARIIHKDQSNLNFLGFFLDPLFSSHLLGRRLQLLQFLYLNVVAAHTSDSRVQLVYTSCTQLCTTLCTTCVHLRVIDSQHTSTGWTYTFWPIHKGAGFWNPNLIKGTRRKEEANSLPVDSIPEHKICLIVLWTNWDGASDPKLNLRGSLRGMKGKEKEEEGEGKGRSRSDGKE